MNEQAIFIAALQHSPEQRAAYLESACDGDVTLRRRVEVLLAAHENAGSFMQQAAAGTFTEAYRPISEGPGTIIGPYKLLQQIGEGGFGVVYMAEQQEPVRRKVALKIIKPGMDTREVIARFEAERQALALMDHPNIARVLDAGTTGEPEAQARGGSESLACASGSGRPYFVMELVKGVPITEFCDKNHLPATGRLELFRVVCLAVQHAHQKGIIHRDLKPSNILVTLHDGQPVPKVIDFGVAKATSQRLTERTLVTGFGQMVGTPAYMSPEQAEMSGLDIDTRSDIYSLGVLLYELLTGTTPLESKRLREAGYAEMQRLIREEEPPRPSTRFSSLSGETTVLAGNRGTDVKHLTQLLRGDLDWIVMKALEKDRNRRYETPGAFAADVERFLHNEPIVARPPSALYKLRKFTRRNRAAVLTAATLLLLLMVGFTGTSLGLVWAMKAEDDARHDAARARDAEQVADDARRDAVAAAKRLETELAQTDSLRLSANSTAMLSDHPGTALLLGIAAAVRSPVRTAVHNNALLAALRACREERTLFAPPYTTRSGSPGRRNFLSAHITPDGTRAVAVGYGCGDRPDRTDWTKNVSAYVYDLQTGKLLCTLKQPGVLFRTMAISPDSTLLAATPGGRALVRYADGQTVAFTDRAVTLWDLRTGEQRRVLKGHTDRVTSLCFDTKGERLLSASWDGTARIWDVATGQVRHVLDAGKVSLKCAEFSPDPDSRRVLTVSLTSLWHSYGGSKAELLKSQFGEPVDPERVVFDPSVRVGAAVRWMAPAEGISFSNGKRSPPQLWDAQTGKPLAALDAAGSGERMPNLAAVAAFTPDGDRVVTANEVRLPGGGGQVQLWNAADGKLVHSAGFGTGQKTTLFSLDGKDYFCDLRSPLLVWQRIDPSRPTWRFAAGGTWFSRGAMFFERDHLSGDLPVFLDANPARPQVATALGETVTVSSSPKLPDPRLHSGFRENLILRGHEGKVTAGAFLPGGKRLLTAAEDGTLRIWTLEGIDPVVTLDRPESFPGSAGRPTRHAVFLPDGKQVLSAGRGDMAAGSAWLSDASSGAMVREVVDQAALAISALHRDMLGEVRDLDVSGDGTKLVTVYDDGNMTTAVPKLIQAAKEKHELQPSSLFTPVRVWNVRTGKLRYALQRLLRPVSTARFSRDGRRMLTFSSTPSYVRRMSTGVATAGPMYTRVDIWEADNGKHLRSIVPETQGSGNFGLWSPDGTRVLTNALVDAGTAAVIYDAWTGKHQATLRDQSGIDEAAFSPDGKLVLGYRHLVSSPGTERPGLKRVEVWESATGAHRFTLSGHTGNVTSAAFSPDSRLILSTSADGTARLWDATTGAIKYVLHGHRQSVRAGCFSPDGKWVATASPDGTARIWSTATGTEWLTLPLTDIEFTSVRFSPDSGRLLTTSNDGTARIWPVDPLPLATARRPRELTADERARFQVDTPR